jgi:hypothetical protein
MKRVSTVELLKYWYLEYHGYVDVLGGPNHSLMYYTLNILYPQISWKFFLSIPSLRWRDLTVTVVHFLELSRCGWECMICLLLNWNYKTLSAYIIFMPLLKHCVFVYKIYTFLKSDSNQIQFGLWFIITQATMGCFRYGTHKSFF